MGTASQLPAASLAGMLRVWKMSGEELVALRREDFSESYDVADELRRLLRNRYGFPVCTQTLLLDGGKLEPTCRLSFPSDLQLILCLGSGVGIFWFKSLKPKAARVCFLPVFR